jgi:hypothetical protein
MIGGGGTGGSFSGLASYLTEDEERVNYTETRNCFERSERPDRVAQEMKDAAAASERVEKPVYHLHVSWPKEDQTTQAERLEAMEEVLEDLGLDDRQALIVEHDDAKPHVHAMVNRVQHDPRAEDYGTAWSRWNDWQKIEASLRRIEHERGWREVPGKKAVTPHIDGEPGESLTDGQFQYFKRTGELPLVEEVKVQAGADFETAESWDDLDKSLREKGLKVERKGRGGVVRDAITDDAVKLSSVGREYSLGKLEDRFDEQFSEYLERREEVDEQPFQQESKRERERPARAPGPADRGADAEGRGRREAAEGASRSPERHEDPERPNRGAAEDVESGSVQRERPSGRSEGASSTSREDAGSERSGAGADRGSSEQPADASARDDGFSGGDGRDAGPGSSDIDPLDIRGADPFDSDAGEADEPEGDRGNRFWEDASESEAESFESGFSASGEADSGEQVDEDLSFEEQLNEILPPEKYGREWPDEGASSDEGIADASGFEEASDSPESDRRGPDRGGQQHEGSEVDEPVGESYRVRQLLAEGENAEAARVFGQLDSEDQKRLSQTLTKKLRGELRKGQFKADREADGTERAYQALSSDGKELVAGVQAIERGILPEEAAESVREAISDLGEGERSRVREALPSSAQGVFEGLKSEGRSEGQDSSKDESESKDSDRGRSRGRGRGGRGRL